MTTRKVKEVSSSLCRKGFVRNADADHIQYELFVDGVKTVIQTKISHGEREIGEYLIHQMARQLGLGKREFLDLVDCGLDGDGYLRLMRERGFVDTEE